MSAVRTPPRPPAAAPPTPARERLRALMGESGYDTDTVQAIADALREQVPTPPWEDSFLVAVCGAIDLLRDAGRTAGQVKTRVAGFKQAAERARPRRSARLAPGVLARRDRRGRRGGPRRDDAGRRVRARAAAMLSAAARNARTATPQRRRWR